MQQRRKFRRASLSRGKGSVISLPVSWALDLRDSTSTSLFSFSQTRLLWSKWLQRIRSSFLITVRLPRLSLLLFHLFFQRLVQLLFRASNFIFNFFLAQMNSFQTLNPTLANTAYSTRILACTVFWIEWL